MKLTLKEAQQNLVLITSSYFLEEIYHFPVDCLKINYEELLSDVLLGEYKQKYKNFHNIGEHAFYIRLDHFRRLDMVASTFNKILEHENKNFASKRFKDIIKLFPVYFVDDLFTKKQIN